MVLFFYVMPFEDLWEVRAPDRVQSAGYPNESTATAAAFLGAREKAAALVRVGVRVHSSLHGWQQFEVAHDGAVIQTPISI